MRKLLFLSIIAASVAFTACNSGGAKKSSTESIPTEVVGVDQNLLAVGTQTLLSVGGSCDMCTDRIIETVSKVDGYLDSSYDLEKQELDIVFDSSKTNIESISKALAAVGHDTELAKADQDVYDALPGCCKYRK